MYANTHFKRSFAQFFFIEMLSTIKPDIKYYIMYIHVSEIFFTEL